MARSRGMSFVDLASSKVGQANKHKLDELFGVKKKKANKFKAIAKVVDGIKFHSTGEAERYVQLQGFKRQGLIKDLRLQVRYKLTPTMKDENGNTVKAMNYVADFVYFNNVLNKEVIEDFKGKRTQSFIDKKKQVLKIYKKTIYETNKKHIKDNVL